MNTLDKCLGYTAKYRLSRQRDQYKSFDNNKWSLVRTELPDEAKIFNCAENMLRDKRLI